MIEIKNVSKSYSFGENEMYALKDLSLKIVEGDWLCVLGPSGSGKTTLLNIISGMDIPGEGEVVIDGISTSSMSSKQLQQFRREKIGYIFQDFRLLPQYNVLDNICLPRIPYEKQDSIHKKALQLMEEVGLSHRGSHLPGELSGGEKQRVAIARALMNNPDILICDEPTGNLDRENRNRILELISLLYNKGHTIIMATHDPEVAKKGNKSIYIRDGQLQPEVLR